MYSLLGLERFAGSYDESAQHLIFLGDHVRIDI